MDQLSSLILELTKVLAAILAFATVAVAGVFLALLSVLWFKWIRSLDAKLPPAASRGESAVEAMTDEELYRRDIRRTS